jgi:diacylglycerol kinase (ATP)
MKQAMIVINPTSGREQALEYVRNAEELLRAEGYEVNVRETQKAWDASRFCASACEECYDLVISIGGDGTLHEVINGLMNQLHRPKLGVVPLGTVNDYARALQIPLKPELAIQTLASPMERAVDMGVGPLGEALLSVSSEDKSRLGALAYFKEGIKELTSPPAQPLHIRYDGQVWEGECSLFLAALTNSVGGFEKLAPDAVIDDGLLHCFIIKDLNLFNTVTVSLSLLLGNLQNHKDVEYFTAQHVSIHSANNLQANIDGEEGPLLPIELSIMPRHIKVIIPETADLPLPATQVQSNIL